jgi:outer membrane lipoprotein SlyB
MRPRQLASLLLLAILPVTACVTTTTSSRTWGDLNGGYGGGWVRTGRVESIRETVQQQHGDPGAGAVAGAIVGGIIGSALGGGAHVDAWGRVHSDGSGAGAFVGAVGGAMVGAAASQGGGERRTYEVFVRFDDGGADTFVYENALPFQVGDLVQLTAQGLVRG